MNTIDAIMPVDSARMLADIAHEMAAGAESGGLQKLAQAINAAYQQHRGCVCHMYNGNSPLFSATSQTVYGRMVVQGGSDVTETVNIWILGERTNTGAPAVNVLEVKIGSATYSAEFHGGTDTIGIELFEQGTLDIADDVEYLTVEASFLSQSNVTSRVHAIFIIYDRSSASLAAADGSSLGYDNTLFVPLDDDQFQNGRPVSLWTVRAMLQNLEYLKKRACGFIAGYTNRSGVTIADELLDCETMRPPEVTESRWHFKTTSNSGKFTVSTSAGAYAEVTVSAAGWVSLTLDHGMAFDSYHGELFIIGGETAVLTAISSWWVAP